MPIHHKIRDQERKRIKRTTPRSQTITPRETIATENNSITRATRTKLNSESEHIDDATSCDEDMEGMTVACTTYM